MLRHPSIRIVSRLLQSRQAVPPSLLSEKDSRDNGGFASVSTLVGWGLHLPQEIYLMNILLYTIATLMKKEVPYPLNHPWVMGLPWLDVDVDGMLGQSGNRDALSNGLLEIYCVGASKISLSNIARGMECMAIWTSQVRAEVDFRNPISACMRQSNLRLLHREVTVCFMPPFCGRDLLSHKEEGENRNSHWDWPSAWCYYVSPLLSLVNQTAIFP